MFVIKTNQGKLGTIYENRPYIIGFSCPRTALHVSKVARLPPLVYLSRSDKVDVTWDVKADLAFMGIQDATFSQLTIDVEAQCTIEKGPRSKNMPFNMQPEIEEMDQGDFMFLSFEKNLGLIMPQTVTLETSDKIMFLSQVIDPPFDIDLFKKNLINGP